MSKVRAAIFPTSLIPVGVKIDDLQVEKGVRYIPLQSQGRSKWDPLFAKLRDHGDSIAFPLHWAEGVKAHSRSKLVKTEGFRFRIAKVSATQARIWLLDIERERIEA